MDNLIETISGFFLTPAAGRAVGSESDQLWNLIRSLLPLAIIVFFWLLGRRAKTKTAQQSQPTQKTGGASSYELFKKTEPVPQQRPPGMTPMGGVDVDMDSQIGDIPTVQEQPSPYGGQAYGAPTPATPKPIKPRWWG